MWQKREVRYATYGAAALGIAYLAYRLFRTPPPPPARKDSEHSYDDQRLRTVHSNYSEFYFDKQQKLRQILTSISSKGPTVDEIYLLSPLIIVDEYYRYTKEIRKRRRLIRRVNEEQYVGLVRSYEVEVKELLERGRFQILEEFGLTADDMDKMETSYEMFEDLQALKKQSVAVLKQTTFAKDKLRRLPREKLRKIMEEEIGFIEGQKFMGLKAKLQQDQLGISQEEVFKIITTYCDDLIYEKYGYEREEIENQIAEEVQLAKELRKQRQNLFANIVECNIDSLESPDEEDVPQDNPAYSKKTSKTYIVDNDNDEPSFEIN